MISTVVPGSSSEVKLALELIRIYEDSDRNRKMVEDIFDIFLNNSTNLEAFLGQLLIKLKGRLGSELAFIGLVTEIDGILRLVVRDKNTNVVGALVGTDKNYLYNVPVGAHELSPEERSLTGYVASTKKSLRIGNL